MRRLAGALLATACSVGAEAMVGPRPALAQESVRSYRIAAGDLTAALNSFADASQIQLVYDASVTRGLSSPGLDGRYTPSQALARLLAGSGLDWRFANPRTVTITGPAPGAAQAAGLAADGTIVLDEINVSGEKLTRDLGDVYTSVGVMTGEQIDDYVVPDLSDGLNKQANTRVNGANGGNSGIVVRGLSSEGLTQPINQTPAVAVVLDGATQNIEGIRRGSRGTWDVESFEVLRGPQSSLQGNNGMGGAVIVNTYDPSWTWTGAVQGDFSHATDYDGYSRDGAFMLSGPLVENQLAFRVSGQIIDGEKGIAYADPVHESLDDDDFEQIRAKALFTPDALDGFSALLSYSHTRDKPAVPLVTGPDFYDRRLDLSSTSSAMDIRDTTVDNYVADLSQDFGNGIVVRSVTALIETEAEIDSIPGQPTYLREDVRAASDVTQDLRVELAPDSRPISGVAGLYYGNFDAETTSYQDYYMGSLIFDLDRNNTTESFAFYADFRYEFHDRWALLFGGRLGQDTVRNRIDGYQSFFGMVIPTQLDAEEEFLVALPKIGLAYEIAGNQTLAATISEGYRPGFSGVDTGGSTYTVESEKLWAYEIAYRSQWLDGRLDFNVNAFYYDFSDIQVEIPDPVAVAINPDLGNFLTVTRNLESAYAYGAEFEVRYRPTEEWTTFASLGLLKTQFDEAQAPDGGPDYSGNEFAEAPPVTFNVGAVYKHPSGFFASGDISVTADYFSALNVDNDPSEKVAGYALVNAAVGYEAERGSLALYVKNLFDEEYVTGISDSGASAIVGDGRTIGVRAKARF